MCLACLSQTHKDESLNYQVIIKVSVFSVFVLFSAYFFVKGSLWHFIVNKYRFICIHQSTYVAFTLADRFALI